MQASICPPSPGRLCRLACRFGGGKDHAGMPKGLMGAHEQRRLDASLTVEPRDRGHRACRQILTQGISAG